jgi:hypothetical protein
MAWRLGMNFIKFILAIIGLILGAWVVLWVLGAVWSMLWYLVVFGLLAGVLYGGYRLFTTIEAKALGAERHSNLTGVDVNMSWDEYERKYLKK